MQNVVLDTQAVLDWLVFGDAACARWGDDLKGGDWRWVATALMRDELNHVLDRGLGVRWTIDRIHIDRTWEANAHFFSADAGSVRDLRCTDPDDQKFLDLAVHACADWLISRDRAVLKRRRQAWQRYGIRIATPQQWAEIRAEKKKGGPKAALAGV